MKKLSKKKITIIVAALLIGVCGIVFGMIAVIENSRLNNAYVSEYIQEYDAKEHQLQAQLFADDDKFIFSSEDKQTFTDVGDYDCFITVSNEKFLIVKSKTVSVKYIIKDTTKPVFADNVPTEIEVYKDCEIENIEETFKATDLAPVTISFDKERIDYATVGEYTTNVYATDASGNVTNKEIKVKVLEPTITLDKTSLNMTVGATETITATVNGKDQNIEWSSSDESVAKVENGKVTGIKAGTVKITAKSNGIEVICEIKVKAKASISSNKGSSSKPSNNGSSSKTSSNSNNGGNSSSNSSNGGISSSNNSGEGITTTEHVCCHIGNCGRRFNSYSELDNYYLQWVMKQGGNYSGYFNAWQCSCGKWSADFISY